MRALATGLGLLLAAPTAAADLHGEVSLDVGLLTNGDQTWDLFSRSDLMASHGARVGYALDDHVTFVLGWQRYRRGQSVTVPGQESFRAAFDGHAVTLGPKVGAALSDWLYPYVTTQAIAFLGVVRFDDDPGSARNPGQVLEASLTPGVLGMGGLELRVPLGDELMGALHVEGGYQWLARGTYGDFGSMRPGGLAVRSGIGLRF